MKGNLTLAIVAGALCLLSYFSYHQSVSRAERFERGQKFLAQLNSDEIAVVEISKGEENVLLKRSEGEFMVASHHNYPAKNETMNRFLSDLLEVSLEKRVGSGESLEKELELVPGTGEATSYTLKNEAGKVLVNFVVGKSSENGRGNFLKRLDGEDQDLYLSSRGVFLSSKADNFLKKELLDVKAEDILSIKGSDYVINNVDGNLKLDGVPKGKKEGGEFSQVKNMLSGLRYENVFLADDPAVSSLKYSSKVEVKLKDESGYEVEIAKSGDKYYMSLKGTFGIESIAAPEQDASEEELKEKADILARGKEMMEFNSFHGSWVYEITEFVAKKFTQTKATLIEDVKEDAKG